MKTQLVIMAAGIGSRFGHGIKQLEKIGKHGEVIMEYSVSEAIKAGFDEAVVIIRHEIEKDFKEIIGNRIDKKIKTRYAFQELNNLPAGFTAPADRKKPYGTAHCLLCAKDVIDSPFCVINADDYYGNEGFKKIHDYLINNEEKVNGKINSCMAGFKIGNTLSDHGTVTRGVCTADNDGNLKSVTETYEIKRREDGEIYGEDDNKKEVHVDKNSLVSMNMWGLPRTFIEEIDKRFEDFLKKNNDNIKSEYLLPIVIDDLIKSNQMDCKVLSVNDKWYGITYENDVPLVKEALKDIDI